MCGGEAASNPWTALLSKTKPSATDRTAASRLLVAAAAAPLFPTETAETAGGHVVRPPSRIYEDPSD